MDPYPPSTTPPRPTTGDTQRGRLVIYREQDVPVEIGTTTPVYPGPTLKPTVVFYTSRDDVGSQYSRMRHPGGEKPRVRKRPGG